MSLSSEVEHIDESLRDKKFSVSSEDRNVKAASVFIAEDIVDIDANVQYTGVLKKPPFGSKGYGMLTRWTDRFFVVKESFMLYYDKSEKKSYETKKMFNIHPKGVIPLANCSIEKWDDAGKIGFKIIHPSFKMGNLVLVARNAEERDNWVSILQESSKITWNNAQLGAAQILQLEENTERISKERVEYIEKLHAEAEARKHETGKKEELEMLAKQLEEEKATVENIANQFKKEKEMTSQELTDAMNAMKKLDEERRHMDKASKELEENLKKVEIEKEQQNEAMKQQQEEKEKLAATSSQLQTNLETVSEQAKQLAVEKKQTEEQLQENEKKAQVFEEEKKVLQRTATEAQINLEEIAVLKERTELELGRTASVLEKEKKERYRLEKRLRLAEDSLKRLDNALKESGIKVSIEIEADVGTLKSFFEDAVADAEHQAKKHLFMEDAVRAKKCYEKEAYKKKKNIDFVSALANMTKVEVDPRLKGESQSTSSPSPENRDIPDEEPVINLVEEPLQEKVEEPVSTYAEDSIVEETASELAEESSGTVEQKIDSSGGMVNGESEETDGVVSPGEIVPVVSEDSATEDAAATSVSLENGAPESISPQENVSSTAPDVPNPVTEKTNGEATKELSSESADISESVLPTEKEVIVVEEPLPLTKAPTEVETATETEKSVPEPETVAAEAKCNGDENSQTLEVGEGS